nr:hypothetical protein [uncultured Rhodopila sp.]
MPWVAAQTAAIVRKMLSGSSPARHDMQFGHMNAAVTATQSAGRQVIRHYGAVGGDFHMMPR